MLKKVGYMERLIFDANLSASLIKKRHEWQVVYKKLNKEESEKKEYEIITEHNRELGGHFAKKHEELDNLNNKFSDRSDEVNKKSSLPTEKGKKKEENEENEEKLTKIRNA
ncbi:hypothetical protein C1646_816490 [Rhizophagus diaphanus]|nr:hypothetical protein C1646_816490 [Rhizophagus diaphanus] [Rhizophagus sp. MUCL 43196]